MRRSASPVVCTWGMSSAETTPDQARPADLPDDAIHDASTTCGSGGDNAVRRRVEALVARGVRVVDPCQTFVDADVDPARVDPSAVLHPGTRLHGASLLLGPRAEVGTEGPATVRDCALGADTSIASGFAHGTVLLDAPTQTPVA